jgi:hypothetical protein
MGEMARADYDLHYAPDRVLARMAGLYRSVLRRRA